jgi:hypothetical protein
MVPYLLSLISLICQRCALRSARIHALQPVVPLQPTPISTTVSPTSVSTFVLDDHISAVMDRAEQVINSIGTLMDIPLSIARDELKSSEVIYLDSIAPFAAAIHFAEELMRPDSDATTSYLEELLLLYVDLSLDAHRSRESYFEYLFARYSWSVDNLFDSRIQGVLAFEAVIVLYAYPHYPIEVKRPLRSIFCKLIIITGLNRDLDIAYAKNSVMRPLLGLIAQLLAGAPDLDMVVVKRELSTIYTSFLHIAQSQSEHSYSQI